MNAPRADRNPVRSRSQLSVLVTFAVKEEAEAFHKLTASRADILTVITGIGQRNACEAVLRHLNTVNVQHVFTCGFAGGLNPELSVGDLVFATDDEVLAARLTQAGAKRGKFFCAEKIVVTAADKRALRNKSGADAVEMESATIQELCREKKVPCATVRVISDAAQEDLPLDFNQLMNPDLSLNYKRLSLAVAKSPGKIPALLRLQKNTRRGADRLANLLVTIIGPERTTTS